MKKESTELLKLAGVTAGIFILISLSMGGSSDLHFHDTFIIMDGVTKFILLVVVSVFVVSLVAAVFSRFRNKLYNKILLYSLFLIISSGMYVFSVFVRP